MLQLIPLAYYAQEKSGVFAIDEQLKVNSDFDLELLKLEKAQDGKLVIKKDSSLDKEEYKLEVTPDLISIKASSEAGAYYALQTLRQIVNLSLAQKKFLVALLMISQDFLGEAFSLMKAVISLARNMLKKCLI